ncbi:MAG: sensor histidine kinase [Flavobacteriaceae bacterium]
MESSIKYKQILLHIAIWAIFIVLNLMRPHIEASNLIKHTAFLLFGTMALFYINYFYLVPWLLLKKHTVIYVLVVIALLLMSTYLFTEFPLEAKPDHGFPPPMPEINPKPIVNFRILGPFVFNVLLVATGTALRLYGEWYKNDRKKKEIEVQKSSTELHYLKHQLNPHFLFNSLNSIYALTTQKSNDAPEAVITLSELMRYMLYETNNTYVPLEKELDYVQNYLKLQRLRIANNENVTLNIHGHVANQKIKPLLLISFIENAFKYGTDFKGHTEVKIEINVSESELHFKCTNLIGRKKENAANSGIGLKNTKERLELLYPNKHALTVGDFNNKFTVDLILKLS